MTWLHFPQNLSLLNVLISLTVSSTWKLTPSDHCPGNRHTDRLSEHHQPPNDRQPHSEEGTPPQPHASAGEVWLWQSHGARTPAGAWWHGKNCDYIQHNKCPAENVKVRNVSKCSIGLPYSGLSYFEKVRSCWKLTLWCITASSGHVQPTVSRSSRLKHCWF